ncbi:hypothetical protein FPY71_03400 [Aureimonas fodinaquatilis]|uniref:Uncharacterized protein n=1 Tax=Aureimonas fodinaquatilis TaxID=2565783 RepID=A0A5B0E1K1_9HYPH|nr:hypothetical protein [Aureimonas fodinaquatilis]KAA0972172.1 hypothetical protein FPY71_03400 [Aureimonas fodinaquatilis]
MDLRIELFSPLHKNSIAGHFLLRNRKIVLTGQVNGVLREITRSADIATDVTLPALTNGQLTIDVVIETPASSDSPASRPCLHVRQLMQVAPKAGGVGFTIIPFAWEQFELHKMQESHSNRHLIAGLHPLITFNPATKLMQVNVLMLDVTAYWLRARLAQQHINGHYAWLAEYIDHRTRLRVVASLAETPMIWYIVCPKSLEASAEISPHVFYSPADHAELQPYRDRERYFFDMDYASGKRSYKLQLIPNRAKVDVFDGGVLSGYLAVPTDEARAVHLSKQDVTSQQPAPRPLTGPEMQRNVFRLVGGTPEKPEVNIFNSSMGFSKAFGEGTKTQLLMIPQRTHTIGSGIATKAALPTLYRTIISVLESNSWVLGKARREKVKVGQLVLSCFSDAGASMWAACKVDAIVNELKGIVCMEPMPGAGNAPRDATFRQLKKRGKQIHYLGSWKSGQFSIAKDLRDKTVTRLYPNPENYDTVFSLPPKMDPAVSPFIYFRTLRFLYPDEDISLSGKQMPLTEERVLLNEVRRSMNIADGPLTPVDEKRLIDRLFKEVWIVAYYHRLATAGGEVMELGKRPFYGEENRYKTFLQEAVEALN